MPAGRGHHGVAGEPPPRLRPRPGRVRLQRRHLAAAATSFPIPDLAVGRLVETPAEIDGHPRRLPRRTTAASCRRRRSSLVTGYDFLADAADAVETDLDAGHRARPADALITPERPSRRSDSARSWTATAAARRAAPRQPPRPDLPRRPLQRQQRARRRLLDDVLTTRPRRARRSTSTNSIVFSAGCHSGLQHRRRRRHPRRDAAARLGAGVRAEGRDAHRRHRLPVRRHRLPRVQRADLRRVRARSSALGSRPGRASATRSSQAKQDYLAATPDVPGIDEKALLEATLFGLPMLSVNLPAGRIRRRRPRRASRPTPCRRRPGCDPRSAHADLDAQPALTSHTRSSEERRRRLERHRDLPLRARRRRRQPGRAGAAARLDDVSVPASVLRGVGFRGGAYTDRRSCR